MKVTGKSLHTDLCKEDSLFDNDMIVTSNEIEDIIKDLAYNKSSGLDGIIIIIIIIIII